MRSVFRQFGRLDWVRPAILLLLICHLGRFYCDAPLALAICFEHNHQESEAAEVLTADGSSAHQLQAATDDGDDQSGFKLHHCKDSYQGMNLIPVAVLSLPAEEAMIAPAENSSMIEIAGSPRALEPPLSIFHPPQLTA